jgi:hypothetical protein
MYRPENPMYRIRSELQAVNPKYFELCEMLSKINCAFFNAACNGIDIKLDDGVAHLVERWEFPEGWKDPTLFVIDPTNEHKYIVLYLSNVFFDHSEEVHFRKLFTRIQERSDRDLYIKIYSCTSQSCGVGKFYALSIQPKQQQ